MSLEKQGIPYHDTYNPKAGINLRLGKLMSCFLFLIYFTSYYTPSIVIPWVKSLTFFIHLTPAIS